MQNVRMRASQAITRTHGDRIPRWADRALRQLDDPTPESFTPYAGRGYRLTDYDDSAFLGLQHHAQDDRFGRG